MAVEAPLSKFNRDNYKIAIAVLVAVAIWFSYDGYLSKSFHQEHVVNKGGEPDLIMLINRYSPPVLAVIAVLVAVRLAMVKDRKVTAGDDAIVLADGKTIPYKSIQQIDKTWFESKGRLIVTYKTQAGTEAKLLLSGRTYDNMAAVLDVMTAKITGRSA